MGGGVVCHDSTSFDIRIFLAVASSPVFQFNIIWWLLEGEGGGILKCLTHAPYYVTCETVVIYIIWILFLPLSLELVVVFLYDSLMLLSCVKIGKCNFFKCLYLNKFIFIFIAISIPNPPGQSGPNTPKTRASPSLSPRKSIKKT